MFEVGFSELLLIMALALIVLGPEKLPKVASQVGRWMGRARAMARQFRETLEEEVQLEPTVRRPGAASTGSSSAGPPPRPPAASRRPPPTAIHRCRTSRIPMPTIPPPAATTPTRATMTTPARPTPRRTPRSTRSCPPPRRRTS
jgi:sec-independent protein translocase protein TatB